MHLELQAAKEGSNIIYLRERICSDLDVKIYCIKNYLRCDVASQH
jgi:hypothetical protein